MDFYTILTYIVIVIIVVTIFIGVMLAKFLINSTLGSKIDLYLNWVIGFILICVLYLIFAGLVNTYM